MSDCIGEACPNYPGANCTGAEDRWSGGVASQFTARVVGCGAVKEVVAVVKLKPEGNEDYADKVTQSFLSRTGTKGAKIVMQKS